MKPYIGVTGVTCREETDALLACVPDDAPRSLMLGVLVSYKTLFGEAPDRPGRYPTRDRLAGIFSPDPRALNLVHYCPGRKRLGEFSGFEMYLAMHRAGPYCHGVQLNLAPCFHELAYFRSQCSPSAVLVQQFSRSFLAGRDPKWVWDAARLYSHPADAILIDPSGGQGQPFDPVWAAEIVTAAREGCAGRALVGIAGGLHAGNVREALAPWIAKDPGICWDAEGRLRCEDDTLDAPAAQQYIRESFALLG